MALIHEISFKEAEKYSALYLEDVLRQHGVELENGIDWGAVFLDLFKKISSLVRHELADKAWAFYEERKNKTLFRWKPKIWFLKLSIAFKWSRARIVFVLLFGEPV